MQFSDFAAARKAVYRSSEFILLYAGIYVVQDLSDSFVLLALQIALPAIFIASATLYTFRKVEKTHSVLAVIAALCALLVSLAVVEAGRQAAGAAISQITSPRAEAQIERRALRRKMMGNRLDCADENAFYGPSCQAFLNQEQAAEKAIR